MAHHLEFTTELPIRFIRFTQPGLKSCNPLFSLKISDTVSTIFLAPTIRHSFFIFLSYKDIYKSHPFMNLLKFLFCEADSNDKLFIGKWVMAIKLNFKSRIWYFKMQLEAQSVMNLISFPCMLLQCTSPLW